MQSCHKTMIPLPLPHDGMSNSCNARLFSCSCGLCAWWTRFVRSRWWIVRLSELANALLATAITISYKFFDEVFLPGHQNDVLETRQTSIGLGTHVVSHLQATDKSIYQDINLPPYRKTLSNTILFWVAEPKCCIRFPVKARSDFLTYPSKPPHFDIQNLINE